MRSSGRSLNIRSAPDIDLADVWTPGDADQMDALVAACALVRRGFLCL